MCLIAIVLGIDKGMCVKYLVFSFDHLYNDSNLVPVNPITDVTNGFEYLAAAKINCKIYSLT